MTSALGLHEPRPPYVKFDYVAVEDRAASEEAGYKVLRNELRAYITPIGSTDTVEKVAETWIKEKKNAVAQGQYNPAWLEAHERMLKAYLDGHEIPESGVPIRGCLHFLPSQQEQILNGGIRTLEDLAEANEQALNRIGMGAREWKATAQRVLAAAVDVGKLAGRLEALELANKDKDDTISDLRAVIADLSTQLEVKRRGRPPMNQE